MAEQEELRTQFNNCTRCRCAIHVDLLQQFLAVTQALDATSVGEDRFLRFPLFDAGNTSGKKICVEMVEFSSEDGEVIFQLGNKGEDCPKTA